VPELRSGVAVVDREEFISSRFRYEPGQHVTFLGRTDSGKTTLAYQLIEHVSSPKLPAVSLVVKPKSPTVNRWAKKLGHPIVRQWPPPMQTFRARPPGWVFWPKHSFDPDKDDAMLYERMRRALHESYKHGKRIVFADETLGLSDLGLDRTLVALWTRGREMNAGLWAATQKPSHIPLYAYNQATHLFLAYESDKRGRQRFSELAGFDPRLIEEIVLGLRKWEWLYINQDDRTMCIVSP
jgi:hypothetical protein